MERLNPNKLHVSFENGIASDTLVVPRRYTLTHSDRTGELYLYIGGEYNREQISGWYTRLMRDEVLAEINRDATGPALHIYCHVSGGFVIGTAGFRFRIFQSELTRVLEAFRFGDRKLFEANPELDELPVTVYYTSRDARYNTTEPMGKMGDYR